MDFIIIIIDDDDVKKIVVIVMIVGVNENFNFNSINVSYRVYVDDMVVMVMILFSVIMI
jgi:hypothetical protein